MIAREIGLEFIAGKSGPNHAPDCKSDLNGAFPRQAVPANRTASGLKTQEVLKSDTGSTGL